MVTLRVGKVPGRVQPALYSNQGGDVEILGYIRPGKEQRAAQLLNGGTPAPVVDDWTPHGTPTVHGASTVTYLRSKSSPEGAHLVACVDGSVRVLPDGHTTGQRRSRMISEALTATQEHPQLAYMHLVGVLTLNRFRYEIWEDQ